MKKATSHTIQQPPVGSNGTAERLPVGRHSLLRELNTAAVLRVARELRRFTMLALAQGTALSQGTLSTIVKELVAEGYLSPLKDGPSEGGRPPRRYEWNPRARCVVGVDLDARGGLEAGVADLDGRVMGEVGTRPFRGREVEPGEVLDAVEDAIGRSGVDRGRLVGIGCAARGVVDPATGTVLWGSTLPWRNVPLREMLESRFGVPAWVEDTCNVMALAEHAAGRGWNTPLDARAASSGGPYPSSRGRRNLIYVHVGRGVSSGIVIHGEVYRGASGHAGEFGHTVVATEGEPCACGRRGCLETLASWPAVLRHAEAALALGRTSRLREAWCRVGELRPDDVTAAAEAGDALALHVLREAIEHAARGIVNLANLLNPELVVVGGSLVEAYPEALPRMQQIVAAEALPTAAARVEIMAPALSSNAGLRAAAMLAVREWAATNGGFIM